MGGKGSGRTKADWTAKKYEGSARSQQTPETAEFYTRLRTQMGDRLFEVTRVYPSGKKAELGTVRDTKADTLGKMFGAGEYELREVDRGTGEATSKPPVKRILHPGKYRIIEKYAQDPMDAELQLAADAAHRLTGGAAGAGAGELAGLNAQQIYEKAKADALTEMKREQQIELLRAELAGLKAMLEQRPQGQLDQMGGMAQLREMMGLVKELMPPPVPNALMMPQTPMDTVRQAAEAIKMFQTEFQGLGLSVGAPKESSALPQLIGALKDIAQSAIPAFASPRPLPMASRPATAPAPVMAGAQAAAPAPAPHASAAPAPAPAPQVDPEQQRIDMLTELAGRLRQDQADQLATPPRSKVQDTVAWIRSRWSDPNANEVWRNLPNVIAAFSEGAIVSYIAQQAGDLVDSDAKKNWMLAVVDLLKKPA